MEGINKLFTYQSQSGSIIACFIILPFGAFFPPIGSNKSFIYNRIDNGIEIYRSEAAFFFNKLTLKVGYRSFLLLTMAPWIVGSWSPRASPRAPPVWPLSLQRRSDRWVTAQVKHCTIPALDLNSLPSATCSAGLPHTFSPCRPYFSTSDPSSVHFFAVRYWGHGEKGQLLRVRQTLALFLQPSLCSVTL